MRDALLGETVSKDVDLEVHGTTAARLSAALRATGGRVDEVGASFGVIKVTLDGEDFDVSLPRRDSKTGAGHKGFTVQLDGGLTEAEAFGRRDFTINAIGWDPATAEMVDPWGGARDVQAGVLRHTTDAFGEDPLRVLRGVQLAARFDMALHPDTADLCRDLAPAFAELPKERVWGEFDKLFRLGKHPSAGMVALHEAGWEDHLPELAAVRDVPQDPRWHPEGPVHVHLGMSADEAAAAADARGWTGQQRTVVVAAAMLHDLGKATHTQHRADGAINSHGHAQAGVGPALSLLERIGAPRGVTDQVGPLVGEHMNHLAAADQEPTASMVTKLQRRLAGNGSGPDLETWAAVVEADCAGRGPGSKPSAADAWLRVADSMGTRAAPRTRLLGGDHLVAAGMKPGPRFGPILDAALQAQDDGVFDDEAGAVRWFAAHRAAFE